MTREEGGEKVAIHRVEVRTGNGNWYKERVPEQQLIRTSRRGKKKAQGKKEAPVSRKKSPEKAWEDPGMGRTTGNGHYKAQFQKINGTRKGTFLQNGSFQKKQKKKKKKNKKKKKTTKEEDE